MSIAKSYNEISSTSFNDRNDSGKISSIGILPTFSSVLLCYFFRCFFITYIFESCKLLTLLENRKDSPSLSRSFNFYPGQLIVVKSGQTAMSSSVGYNRSSLTTKVTKFDGNL